MIGAILSGCSSWTDSWSNRNGPGAVLEPDKVDTSAGRQADVLLALGRRYRIYDGNHYRLVLAGFNYADEVCSFYLDNLHQFERRKGRIQNTLTLATSTATAVMSASDVSKDAVLYVTQALGFSSAWVGIVAESYLYRLSPGILNGIVRTLHDAYRADVAANPGAINSAEIAYYKIREYYSLCLPVTLETQIEEYLATAKGGVQTTKMNGVTAVTLSQGVTYTKRGVPVVAPRPR